MKKTVGFTLVELLIVVGILSVLLGLLTPAILRNMKAVSSKQLDNEMRILEAAIMEYWSDEGRWPIPKKGEAGYQAPNENSIVTFQADNHVIVKRLLERSLNSNTSKKDYIDPAAHLTTAEACSASQYPNFAVAKVDDVLNGHGGLSKRQAIALVYWTTFIECPHCPSDDFHRYQNPANGTCDNPSCSFVAREGYRYPFTRADKRAQTRGLLPIKMTFNLLSNTVSVSR